MCAFGSCEIEFEKKTYRPGDPVSGKVCCTFPLECIVRDIIITFSGRAKVCWSDGDGRTYAKIEPLFKMKSSLLQSQTKFGPGRYVYPFTLNLPENLPSSVEATCGMSRGRIKYKARVKINRKWSLDCTCEKIFEVYTCNDLNAMSSASPVERSIEKIPTSLGVSGPIQFTVSLSDDRCVPNQVVRFVARVKNDSCTTVNELRFRIVQGFTFHVKSKREEITVSATDLFAVVNSVVEPGVEKFWKLQLKIPANMSVASLPNCNVIKVFWELRGEVRLSFPHRNMRIEVPLRLGPVSPPENPELYGNSH
ncbi:hypothetical protein PPYR_03174 [Photinus pyralis]|uniref:Arrestin C-terminal-like domain-containing protein n=1 Tax=Photinus pyralis TaxID=7054 RepID=A0A5N4A211_PHOPY|nr:arrestin domain-containing protein 2-like [Photinus pyralis]XP_031332008.1 arrestin domain-containing protein 2-like [Photinus pyralis]XP_031332009.1 arrestin domain-containing protein 2-like [Photinus pyralis]KAB0791374.1 hypothetical protein PPYR_03174 [Photinus pyralis]